MNIRTCILITTMALATGGMSRATASAARCTSDSFLSINGMSASDADTGRRRETLTEAQLLDLPSASITTGTEWTPRSRFDGPLLSAVLALAGVQGKSIRLFALDGYSITIPWSDMERYRVILALSRNGDRLSNSKFGPLFLIYPRDQFASTLDTPTGAEKFIWQVCSIHVQ
jgi:hypothetical protein